MVFRNCGFVAYMKREDAVKAQIELNGKDVEGFPIRVGWGSCVPIPPHPVYIPPHLQGYSPSHYISLYLFLALILSLHLSFSSLPFSISIFFPPTLTPSFFFYISYCMIITLFRYCMIITLFR